MRLLPTERMHGGFSSRSGSASKFLQQGQAFTACPVCANAGSRDRAGRLTKSPGARYRVRRISFMKTCRILLLILLVLLCVVTTRSAPRQTSSQDDVIRINVNLVQVDAVVTDGNGKPV